MMHDNESEAGDKEKGGGRTIRKRCVFLCKMSSVAECLGIGS